MIGKKIRYYRLKRGLTTEELAKAIGYTKAAISLYESEEREPDEKTCLKIANALDIPWVELISRDDNELVFDHIGFRKKQKASKKDIELLKNDIERECASRIVIMDILGLVNEKKFKAKKLSFDDEPSINASKIRAALGLPLSGPIQYVTNILEHAGIIVLSFECAEEIDGLNGTVSDIPYIFFNSKNRTIERQRFTIIHETCHLFFNNSNGEKETKQIEKYINKVAGNVLIPTDDIYRIFGKTNRNLNYYLRRDISKEYKIAPSCLITRLFESGVVTEMYYKNFFKFLNSDGGRKNEESYLDEIKDSEQPTLFVQQVYLALSEELITKSRAAELLRVPLYDVMQNARVE